VAEQTDFGVGVPGGQKEWENAEGAPLDPFGRLRRLVRMARQLTSAAGACILIREGAGWRVHCSAGMIEAVAGCRCDGLPDAMMPFLDRLEAVRVIDRLHTQCDSAKHEVDHPPQTWVLAPQFSRSGARLGVLGVVDSEHRAWSADDIQYVEDLAHASASELELDEALLRLDHVERGRDVFLNRLAHELRNSLAGIANAGSVLSRVQTQDTQMVRMCNIIQRQSSQLTRLIDNLLDVSRSGQGKLELHPELVRLEPLLEQAVEAIRPLLILRHHTMTIQPSKRPVLLETDPGRLTQMLIQLLHNAAKFTEPGGDICLSAEWEGEGVFIQVRDTGIGIPESMMSRIFDVFLHEQQVFNRIPGGVGIGLALVDRIARLLGGRITVRSGGRDQGSEFRLWLPRANQSFNVSDEVKPNGEPSIHPSLRVLIVDDNVDVAETLAELLGLWGVQVLTTHRGSEALEAAVRYQPDVVLLDLHMPGMSGFEIALALNQKPGLSSIPLVALTGLSRDADRQACQDVGIAHFLSKPVRVEALHRLLAMISKARAPEGSR